MESASGSYTFSFSGSFPEDDVAPAAPPVPNEQAVNAAFEQLCRDVCLIFWSRTRSNISARALAATRMQYKRRLDRLTVEEVVQDVSQQLGMDHQWLASSAQGWV